MIIKLTDFGSANYENIQVISNTESGMFAVQYEQAIKADKAKLTANNGWHYDKSNDYYELVVPLPKQRNVLRSVTVARTSTNHYEIAYADTLGCVFQSAKTMTAVHDILRPLWERKLNQ